MPDYQGKHAGNYTILQKLGDGGFATVFLAQHTVLEKKAAVKFLLEEWIGEADVVARFFDEARTMERLQEHPCIIKIIDIASKDICDKEGLPPYFIMEYVDGQSLEKQIHSDQGFTLDFIIDTVKHALSALGHCHKMAVVHRDIKPSNIMIAKDGSVKLTDFGIAKAKLNTSKTGSGLTLGSTDYMSPEQALGKRDLDHRSDIYSIGVTLYEMVTGKLPFVADNPNSVALMHIQEEPKPPIEVNDAVPPKLNALILKAMEKKKEDRYQTCEEMIQALDKLNEPDAPVEAEVTTVDLKDFKANPPEDALAGKHEEPVVETQKHPTLVQKSLKSPGVRLSLMMFGLAIFFGLIILGGVKLLSVYNRSFILLETYPAGADIMLGETLIGTSPREIPLAPGVYRIQFNMKGYRELPMRLDLPGGQNRQIKKYLRPIEPDAGDQLDKILKSYRDALQIGNARQRANQTNEVLNRVVNFLEEHLGNEEVQERFTEFAIEVSLTDDALVFYRKRIEKNGPNAILLTMTGKLKMAKKDLKGALEELNRGWQMDPDFIPLINALGDYFRLTSNPDKAKMYYELSLYLNREQPDVLQKMSGF